MGIKIYFFAFAELKIVFLSKSTGIIVAARSITATQPVAENGTQLNILLIHSNGAKGMSEIFTIAA